MKKSIAKQYFIKIFYVLLALLFLCVIGFNIFLLVNRIRSHQNTVSDIEEINKIASQTNSEEKSYEGKNSEVLDSPTSNTDYFNYIKIPISEFDLKKFKEINSDTVGFLSVLGTKINYPVTQSKDNDYYLTHSFKKSDSSAGWVFMDYRNDSQNFGRNTIIYAHSNLDKTMFGSLSNVLHADWVNNKENGTVKFANSKGISKWKIFSVYTIPAEFEYIRTKFKSSEDYRTWAEKMSQRSKYNFGYKFDKDEKVMTFSTCYDNARNLRLVVHAKFCN